MFIQHKYTVMDEFNGNNGNNGNSSHKSLYRDPPLYEDHKIRRATAGEPWWSFGECVGGALVNVPSPTDIGQSKWLG